MSSSPSASQRAAETQLSSLGVLDGEHMAIFRNALDNLLLTEISESTYAEIIDGIPTLDSWNEFHYWVTAIGNPIVELEHKELCAGSREKARRLRSEFDVYILLFPSQVRQIPVLNILEDILSSKRLTLPICFYSQENTVPVKGKVLRLTPCHHSCSETFKMRAQEQKSTL